MPEMKIARPPRVCIFCGNAPLTKEHMFGKWLRKYIPAIGEVGKHYVRHGSSPITRGKMHGRQGGVLSGQLRVVCGPCNNGWMGQTQSAVRPHLIPLFAGNWDSVGPEACSAIATWFTLVSMVSEFLHPPTSAVTQMERTEFMSTQKPPRGWAVMMGRYFDPTPIKNSGFNHFGMAIYDTVAASKLATGVETPLNSQITSIVMGRIVLHCVSTSSGEIIDDLSSFSLRFNLPIIWPTTLLTQIRAPVLIHNFRSWSALSNDFMIRLSQPHLGYH